MVRILCEHKAAPWGHRLSLLGLLSTHAQSNTELRRHGAKVITAMGLRRTSMQSNKTKFTLDSTSSPPILSKPIRCHGV